MPTHIRNPYTGHFSAGYRFRFKVRSISHLAIYLPLQMKELPQIQLLLKGVSPIHVFGSRSVKEAKKTFNELRKKYDFPFWAASEYYVKDIKDPDRTVPLCLNPFQHIIADTFLRRYFKRELGRYLISKSFGKIGVTTCVQAYILWHQTYHFKKHSYTCTASDISIRPIKTNLCRYLHRDVVPPDEYIYLPTVDSRAFFNTYRSPDYIRGIDLGFVHFADMSRWEDQNCDYASRVYGAATSAVLLEYYSLVVLEGNVPPNSRFDIRKDANIYLPWRTRLANLYQFTRNPFFLDHVTLANNPDSDSILFPINLDLPPIYQYK